MAEAAPARPQMANASAPAAPLRSPGARGLRLPSGLRLPWRIPLTTRILAVNILALALMAGSLFYIDSYRRELLAERYRLAGAEVEITAVALAGEGRQARNDLLARIGPQQKLRLRLYGADGRILADSFQLAPPAYRLVDPSQEGLLQDIARLLDRGMDFLINAPPVPAYVDPAPSTAMSWPEAREALRTDRTVIGHRAAPDATPVIIAATAVGTPQDGRGEVLVATRNARDITQNVRDARQTLAIIVFGALAVSILLSLFLARTIVEPLRKLVRAAVRVRLGRDRSVVVPRLPDRRDEIGLLARAISDMSGALSQRIDAMESFAADVAHEIKNPLTSLRSALESLERVEDPELRGQLLAIARDDVQRVDFLVTEIADASRIDAQLSRAVFEPVDMQLLVENLVEERERRGANNGCRIEIHTAKDLPKGATRVPGDAARLERVLRNLLDNAVSFSAPGATIRVDLEREDGRVLVSVADEGPGIPLHVREKIFERFHSLRPQGEMTGRHSGLGLAIARTIVEAHYGRLTATDRPDGKAGAMLLISLPAWAGEP